jgi:acetyltransferase-like isoleucine patch superfamily enzyme
MKAPFVNEPEFHGHVTCAASVKFGRNCTVWQYATLCQNVILGNDVVVGSGAWIGENTVIGSGTRIQHGAFIPKNTKIGSYVFIGPNAVLTDDRYPAAGAPYDGEPPILKDNCSIGANATVLPGVVVGERAIVGAGSVASQDVLADSIAKGVPARSSS